MRQFVHGWPDLNEELIVSDGRTRQWELLADDEDACTGSPSGSSHDDHWCSQPDAHGQAMIRTATTFTRARAKRGSGSPYCPSCKCMVGDCGRKIGNPRL